MGWLRMNDAAKAQSLVFIALSVIILLSLYSSASAFDSFDFDFTKIIIDADAEKKVIEENPYADLPRDVIYLAGYGPSYTTIRWANIFSSPISNNLDSCLGTYPDLAFKVVFNAIDENETEGDAITIECFNNYNDGLYYGSSSDGKGIEFGDFEDRPCGDSHPSPLSSVGSEGSNIGKFYYALSENSTLVEAATSTTEKHSGNKGLIFRINKTASSGWGANIQQEFDAEKGKVYTAVAWVKTGGNCGTVGTGGYPQLYVNLNTSPYYWQCYSTATSASNGAWQRLQCTYIQQWESRKMNVGVFVQSAKEGYTGTNLGFCVDDIQVIEGYPPPDASDEDGIIATATDSSAPWNVLAFWPSSLISVTEQISKTCWLKSANTATCNILYPQKWVPQRFFYDSEAPRPVVPYSGNDKNFAIVDSSGYTKDSTPNIKLRFYDSGLIPNGSFEWANPGYNTTYSTDYSSNSTLINQNVRYWTEYVNNFNDKNGDSPWYSQNNDPLGTGNINGELGAYNMAFSGTGTEDGYLRGSPIDINNTIASGFDGNFVLDIYAYNNTSSGTIVAGLKCNNTDNWPAADVGMCITLNTCYIDIPNENTSTGRSIPYLKKYTVNCPISYLNNDNCNRCTSVTPVIDIDNLNGTFRVDNISLHRSDTTEPYKYRYSCNDINWVEADFPSNYDPTQNGNYTLTDGINITNASAGCNSSNGSKTIYLQVRDSVGNWSSSIATSTIYDSTAPSLSCSNCPSSGTSANPTFTISATDALVGMNTTAGECRISKDGDESYTNMSDDVACTYVSGSYTWSCTGSTANTGANTYYVACKDKLGNENTAANNLALSYTLQASVPTAPSNLTAMSLMANPLNSTKGSVYLTWTDNSSDETGFMIERKAEGGNFETILSTGSNTTSATDTNALTNKIYTYRVYAYNANGNSGYSNNASVKIVDRNASYPQSFTITANNANDRVDINRSLDAGYVDLKTVTGSVFNYWDATFAPSYRTGFDQDYFFTSNSNQGRQYSIDFNFVRNLAAGTNMDINTFYTGIAYSGTRNIFYTYNWSLGPTSRTVFRHIVTNNGATWTTDATFNGSLLAAGSARYCIGIATDGNYLYCNSDGSASGSQDARSGRVDRYLIGNTSLTWKGYFDIGSSYGEGIAYKGGYLYVGGTNNLSDGGNTYLIRVYDIRNWPDNNAEWDETPYLVTTIDNSSKSSDFDFLFTDDTYLYVANGGATTAYRYKLIDKAGISRSTSENGTYVPVGGIYDDFSDGDYTNNVYWTKEGDSWTVTDGELIANPSTSGSWIRLYDLSRNYTDFIYEFDFTPVSGTGYMGAVFRRSTSSMLVYRYSTWTFWRIYDWGRGYFSDFAGGPPWVNGKTYHIKIVVIGHKITLYVDDIYVGEKSFDGYESGYIGLVAQANNSISIKYDNVRTTPLYGEPLVSDNNSSLGLDANAPTAPSISSITANSPSQLTVNLSESTDLGSTYYYTLDSYDDAGNESNLVVDSGFESNGAGNLTEWTFGITAGHTSISYNSSDNNRYKGNYSLSEYADGFGIAYATQNISVESGQKYLISGWMKPYITSGSAKIYAQSGCDSATSLPLMTNSSPNVWTYGQAVCTTNATTLSLVAEASNGMVGTVYFDDIKVKKINSATVTTGLHATPYYISGTGTGANSWVSSTTPTITGLDVNARYCYQAKARDNALNESAFSSSVCKFTLANIPGMPTVNGATTTSLNVTLDTNSNPAATQFAIYDANTSQYVQANGTLGASAVWQTASAWGTKTVTGLSAGTQHCFKAKSRNGDLAETNFSNQACATTIATSAPTLAVDYNSLYPLNSGLGGMILTWNDQSSETGYKVFRSDNNITFTQIATLAANTTSYDDLGLNDNTTYYYKVAAVYASGDINSNIAYNTTADRSVIPPILRITRPTNANYLDANWSVSMLSMSQTKAPALVVNDAGIGTASWSNPMNAITSDNQYAIATLDSSYEVSNYLKATNFGFNIPSNARIKGIVATIEKYSERDVGDAVIRLIKNGTIVGTNKNTDYSWDYLDTNITYGGANDLWGTTWTTSEINSANFGIVIAAEETYDNPTAIAGVDSITITVYYDDINSYKLLRSNSQAGTYSQIVDTNLTTYRDNTATDTNAPSIPTGLTTSNISQTTIDLNWNASTDNGSIYYYKVNARDFTGNDANSNIDYNIVTSGLKQYMVTDLNTGIKYITTNTGMTITGLSPGTQHCFTVIATDNTDNNSSASSQACASTMSGEISLTSSSHPNEAAWYNDPTADMVTIGTFDHIHYWVTQNATESAANIYANGIQDNDGIFTTSALTSSGTWYVHVVAHNAEHQGTVTDHYTLNYDGIAPTATSVSVASWSGGVTGYTNDSTPALAISASDTGGSGLTQMSFSCNNSVWSNWVSYNTSYSSFDIKTGSGCSNTEGSKVVYVKFKDAAGNESSSVNTGSFILDQTAPTSNSISVASWTGDATYTNDDTPQFNISSTGAYLMKWSCDNTNYSSYLAYATSKNVGSATDWDIKPASLTNGCGTSDGLRTVYVVFRDEAGNESSPVNTGAFTLDQVAPVPSPSTPNNGFRYSSPDPSLTSTNIESTSGLSKCFARIGTTNPPSSPIRYVQGSIENTTCTFSGYSSLSEGTYYWDANAMDKAGNWSSYSSVYSIVRDNTAPTVPSTFVIENDSTAPYWDNVNNSKTDLGFTALESGETCKWNITSTAYASMANNCTVNGTDVNCSFGNLPQTSTSSQYNTRYHACIDDVGNAYAAQAINFGVDWTAPTTSDNSDTTIHLPTYYVTITESDNSSNPGSDITTVYCKGNACTPATPIDNGETIAFTSSERGANILRYRSTDLAGNQQNIVQKTININQLPSFTSASDDASTIKGGTTVTVYTNASDADSTQTIKLVVCKTSGIAGTDCDGGASDRYCTLTTSAGGANPSCNWISETDNEVHVWYAYIFDSLGEGASANPITGSYTTDSTAPTITLSTPTNGSGTSDNTPTFVGSASEPLSACYIQIARDMAFTNIVEGYDGIAATANGMQCTYTPSTALADGTYYWRMKGNDLLGNVGDYDVNYSLEIDTTALVTTLASIAGDESAPYWDTTDDNKTEIVVNGEAGMSCRFGTEDVVYSEMSNDCTVNGTQATCNLGSLTQGANKTYYISCKDSLNNEQTTEQNIDVSFGVDWTAPDECSTGVSTTGANTPVYGYAKSPAELVSTIMSDNVSLDTSSCQYTLNGTDWVAGTWNDASYKCIDSSVALNDGVNPIAYRISDMAGNTQICETIYITKDNDAPTGLTLNFGTITPTSIAVTASGATDSGAGLSPLPYYFEETTASTNSGWVESNWELSNLNVNTIYTFRAKARDALSNESAFTAEQSKYTLANIPGMPTVSILGSSSLTVKLLDINGNPSNTQFAIYDSVTGKYVAANNSLTSSTAVWKTLAGWGAQTGFTLTGVSNNYSLKVKARNGDNVETLFGPSAAGSLNTAPSITSATVNIQYAIPSANVPLVTSGVSDAESNILSLKCAQFAGTTANPTAADINANPNFCNVTNIAAPYSSVGCNGTAFSNYAGPVSVKCIVSDGSLLSNIVSASYYIEGGAPITVSDVNYFWQNVDAKVHLFCFTAGGSSGEFAYPWQPSRSWANARNDALTKTALYPQLDSNWSPSLQIINPSTPSSSSLALATANVAPVCGDSLCSANEYCLPDSIACASGYECRAGCQPKQTTADGYLNFVSGDGKCELGEYDRASDSNCTATFGSGWACTNGCQPITTASSQRVDGNAFIFINGKDGMDINMNWAGYEIIGFKNPITEKTDIKIRTRSAPTLALLASAEWTAWSSNFRGIISSPDNNWLEIQLNLSTQSSSTPRVNALKVFAVPVGGSQCSATYYRLDTNPSNGVSFVDWANPTYSSQGWTLYNDEVGINVTSDGNYGLQFYSESSAGNKEPLSASKSQYILVQKSLSSALDDLCTGIKSDTTLNLNWSASSNSGIWKYELYSSFNPSLPIENWKLVYSSSGMTNPETGAYVPPSTTNYYYDFRQSIPQYCGDGKCTYGENCPQDNWSCPPGMMCSNGCQQISTVYQTAVVCGDGICSPGENCYLDDSKCGTGYACISGCVPVGGTSMWQETAGTNQSMCGDGYCESFEYCQFDNRGCNSGQVCGSSSGSGCRNFIPNQEYFVCGDGTCRPGENCPIDSSFCTANFGNSYVCTNGCVSIDSTISSGMGYNTTLFQTASSKFLPTQGSIDGRVYYRLKTVDILGNVSWSNVKECFIDTESPFNIPPEGRSFKKSIGGRDINFFVPPNALGNKDMNIIIDVNTEVASTFTKGNMLSAYSFKTETPMDFTTEAKPRITIDFNESEMSCYPSCTNADYNKLSIYYYNPDTNEWSKIPTIVDIVNHKMYADVNHFSEYGAGEDTTAPTLSSVAIADSGGYTKDPTPLITIDASSDAEDMNISCSASGPWRNYGYYSSTVDDFDISSSAYGCLNGTEGAFSVYVKVADDVGNWSDAASDSSYYDATMPLVSISSPSEGSTLTSPAVTISYTGTDAASGIKNYWVSNDGENWINNSTSTSYTFTDQINGSHTYYVKATDNADNNSSVASVTVIVNVSSGCTPTASCSTMGYSCGTFIDNCNNILSCGTCSAGYSCINNICTASLQTCLSIGGDVCLENESCPGGYVTASDSERCCANNCVTQLLTCSAQGGTICSEETVCTGNWINASDSERCCSSSCSSKPDLSVVINMPAKVKPNSSFSVVATIYNNGDSDANNFKIVLQRTLGTNTKVVEERSILSISAGDASSTQFTFSYTPSSDPDMNLWAYSNVTFTAYVDYYNSVSESNENNNTSSATSLFGGNEICGNGKDDNLDGLVDEGCGLPNIYVKRVEVGKAKFTANELVKVDFNIVISSEYESSKNFYVSFFKESMQTGEVSIIFIDSINKNGELTLMFVWQAPIGTVFRLSPKQKQSIIYFQDAPLSSFYVKVDSRNNVEEVNESDNTTKIDIVAKFPDLSFESVSHDSVIFAGSLLVDANVQNLGDDDAGSFAVSLYLNGTLKDSKIIDSLGVGKSALARFSLSNIPKGTYDLDLVIDSLKEVDESNELNNNYYSPIYVLDAANEIYSYDKFLQEEPLFVGLWDKKAESKSYSFSVGGLTMPVSETLREKGMSNDYDFLISKISSTLNTIKSYTLNVKADNLPFSAKNFSIIEASQENAFREADKLTVSWWLDPNYLKRMHYARIASLSYMFWQLKGANQ